MQRNSKPAHLRHDAVHEMPANHGWPPTKAAVHSVHNHSGHSAAMFRDKFWLSLALTFPVVFWSNEVQHWLGYHAPVFPRARSSPSSVGTMVVVYGGRVFIQCARRELSVHQPGMMTLIIMALVAS